MKIKHDKKIDAKYISIKQGKIAYTEKKQDWLFFDYSKKGSVLGIEILDSSKHSISVHTIKNKFVHYSILNSKDTKNGKNMLNLDLSSPLFKENDTTSVVKLNRAYA